MNRFIKMAVICSLIGAAGISSAVEAVLDFQNTSARVAMTTDLYSELTNLTLSAWVKTATRPDRYGVIAGRGILNASNGFGLFLHNNGNVYFQARTVDEHFADASAPFSFDNTWHHVTGVRDGDISRLYIDGELAGATTNALPNLYTAGLQFALGARHSGFSWGFYFDGAMAEVRLWNYARSGKQIKSDRFYRLEGTEHGLIGYWLLDEELDDVVFDETEINDNHGTTFDTFPEYTVNFICQRPAPGLLIM